MSDVIETQSGEPSVESNPVKSNTALDLPAFVQALSAAEGARVEWTQESSAKDMLWGYALETAYGAFLMTPIQCADQAIWWNDMSEPAVLDAALMLDHLAGLLTRLEAALGVPLSPADLKQGSANQFSLSVEGDGARILLTLPPALAANTWLKHSVTAPVPDEILQHKIACALHFKLPALSAFDMTDLSVGDLLLLPGLAGQHFTLKAGDNALTIDTISAQTGDGAHVAQGSIGDAPTLSLGPVNHQLQTLLALQSSAARQLHLPPLGTAGLLTGALSGRVIKGVLHKLGSQYCLDVQTIEKDGDLNGSE